MRSCMICKEDSIDKRYQYCLVIITVKWYNKIIVDLARIFQKNRQIRKINRDKDFYTQYRSIRNKLSFEFFFLSPSLPLSHIHINKFTQIFDAYVHNRFRKYLAFTRWKDKLEPTVLFQIFERSRAFPAISIRLNFCATFP